MCFIYLPKGLWFDVTFNYRTTLLKSTNYKEWLWFDVTFNYRTTSYIKIITMHSCGLM